MDSHEPGAWPLTSVSDLQREVLSPRRAILEYQLGERVSHVWLVRDQQIEVFKLPPSCCHRAAGRCGDQFVQQDTGTSA